MSLLRVGLHFEQAFVVVGVMGGDLVEKKHADVLDMELERVDNGFEHDDYGDDVLRLLQVLGWLQRWRLRVDLRRGRECDSFDRQNGRRWRVRPNAWRRKPRAAARGLATLLVRDCDLFAGVEDTAAEDGRLGLEQLGNMACDASRRWGALALAPRVGFDNLPSVEAP